MTPRRQHRHLQAALRGRRRAVAAVVRDRERRLAGGVAAAATSERALMGALLVRPRLIRPFAATHPPTWFTDNGARELMKALFCASANSHLPTAEDLVQALEHHDKLQCVGGAEVVRALVGPSEALNVALRDLDELLQRLSPQQQETIHRDETMDALDELIARDKPPQTPQPRPKREPRQLELFADETSCTNDNVNSRAHARDP